MIIRRNYRKFGAMRGIAFFGGLICLFCASQSLACSVEEGYRVPTNFELVQRADIIVLARVADGPDDMGSLEKPQVRLEIARVLKGAAPANGLNLLGALKWNGKPIPFMPTPLDQSHFSAGLGACIRIFYPKGTLVVAMFEYGQRGTLQIGEPWARAVEDVEDSQSIWVQAIEEYLDILQTANKPSVIEAIERRRKQLETKPDIASQAIAEDLRRHLEKIGAAAKREATPEWRLIDTPMESGLVILQRGASSNGVLLCRAGETSVRLDVINLENPSQLSLALDQAHFEAESEVVKEEEVRGGKRVKTVSGRLRLTPDLVQALESFHSKAAILINDTVLNAAPPLDLNQKFVRRCQALLSASGAN